MTVPQHSEWNQVAARFDADFQQVRRDHLISHVLAAVAAELSNDDLIFFGGTALSRTHLVDARLSEDIDLVAVAPRPQVAAQIESGVRRGLARSHGRPSWNPALTSALGSQPAVLAVERDLSVQIQLLGATGYAWPTEVVDIEQRYSDAPAARLRVLTADGFVAAKLSAWIERGAPRDLYDLWAMSRRSLITPSSARVFAQFGPFGEPRQDWLFRSRVDESSWRRALGHQTRLSVTAVEAMSAVAASWAEATS